MISACSSFAPCMINEEIRKGSEKAWNGGINVFRACITFFKDEKNACF